MDSKFEVVRFGMPGFNSQINAFLYQSKINPIYSSNFASYYQEVQGNTEKNISALVNYCGKPVIGLIFSTSLDSNYRGSKFSYYGLPAVLIVSDISPIEVLDAATQILLQTLNNSNINVSRGQILGPRTFLIDPNALRSNKVERICIADSDVILQFDRVIDLTSPITSILSDYSKSAKNTLKNRPLKMTLTCHSNSPEKIQREFEALKKLHLLSAGKLTRSEASWNLQREMIFNSSALIISGSIADEIVASAMFMINLGSAVYGISASNRNQSKIGLTHHVIDHAIKEFKDNGIREIWMGSQHTSSVSEISVKQKNIEAFKGFFGGSIRTTLVSRADS